jgi:hypothetical protein
MLFRAKVVCPSCRSSRCRGSRWLSLEEKKNHPDSHPHRCLDCSYRFLSPIDSGFGKNIAISLPAALAVLIFAVGITFWLARPGTPETFAPVESLEALGPEVRQAAEGGDADAQFRLAEALLQVPGRSMEDTKSAVDWLQRSAENGNTEAMIVLGRLSRTGVGVLQNFGHASRWIETAAARGNPEGMLEMGRLYRDGVGVDKDLVLAYVWFNRASAARNLDAVREREAIARSLTSEQLKEAQQQSSSPTSAAGVTGSGNVSATATKP